ANTPAVPRVITSATRRTGPGRAGVRRRSTPDASGPRGTASGTVQRVSSTVAARLSPASDQNVARHPKASPTRLPTGTPATLDSPMPRVTLAPQADLRSGGAMSRAVATKTAMRVEWTTALTTRPAISQPNPGASAACALPRTNTSIRAGMRTARLSPAVAAVTSGPARTTARAYALISRPTEERETPTSRAMDGRMPAMTLPAVPVQKVQAIIAKTGRGMEVSFVVAAVPLPDEGLSGARGARVRRLSWVAGPGARGHRGPSRARPWRRMSQDVPTVTGRSVSSGVGRAGSGGSVSRAARLRRPHARMTGRSTPM